MTTRTKVLVLSVLFFQMGTNVFLCYACRHFANEAIRANEKHLKTLEEDKVFVEELQQNLRGGKPVVVK